jgi:hypothetical protein
MKIIFCLLFAFLMSCSSTAPRRTVSVPGDAGEEAARPAAKAETPAPSTKPEVKPEPSPAKPSRAERPPGEPYAMTVVDSASMGNELRLEKEKLFPEQLAKVQKEKPGKPKKDKKGKKGKKKTYVIPGYRIQVYATTDFKEAERKKGDLRSLLEERVSVDYEAPYYKIRVGDFEKEEDTKKLRRSLADMGYEAGVVKAIVRIKK